MRSRLPLLACLLIAAPSSAFAADLRLAWNNCDGAGGLHEINFDCNTNASAQAHTLVASFTAPAGITAYIANQATILVQSQSPVLPDWWQLKGTGQCRTGAATADANFAAGPFGCTDVWAGASVSGSLASYNVGYQGPNQGRMNLVFAVPSANAVPLVEGQEYYAFKVTILNTKTVGTGSCAGCSTPVALLLSSVIVIQPTGTPGGNVDIGIRPGVELTTQSVAGWQCPTQFHVSCGSFGCDYVYGTDCSTPARPSTWGMIKAAYR